uniref:Platelet-derived growth factor receptor-like protein n=1 Tax=Xiphophorus couchianus TaxID=32473 RepID=A0A3B5LUE4_9TELE
MHKWVTIHKLGPKLLTCPVLGSTRLNLRPSFPPILLPDEDEIVVPLHEPFTLTCRGGAKLMWETPYDMLEESQEDNSGLFVTTIAVDEATAMHTGYYVCLYNDHTAEETKTSSIYVYVSDPDSLFVPNFINHVPVDQNEIEIPCRVSDPSAIVTLVNVDTNQTIPSDYDSKKGALGIFPTGTYVCKAIINGKEHTSEQYILSAKRTALLVGDTITVNCLAQGPYLLEDNWKYPGKPVRSQGQILYTLTIPQASTKDSGIYSCSITAVASRDTQTKEIAIQVFAGEFLSIKPEFRDHESAELDDVREFIATISSFPDAHVTWLKDGVPLSDLIAEISTSLKQTSETSYRSILTLIRVREEDSGNYTLRVENGNQSHEISLNLVVKVPAVIVDLMDIHHGSATGQSAVCITRGQPTPVVEWFICKNIKQ